MNPDAKKEMLTKAQHELSLALTAADIPHQKVGEPSHLASIVMDTKVPCGPKDDKTETISVIMTVTEPWSSPRRAPYVSYSVSIKGYRLNYRFSYTKTKVFRKHDKIIERYREITAALEHQANQENQNRNAVSKLKSIISKWPDVKVVGSCSWKNKHDRVSVVFEGGLVAIYVLHNGEPMPVQVTETGLDPTVLIELVREYNRSK